MLSGIGTGGGTGIRGGELPVQEGRRGGGGEGWSFGKDTTRSSATSEAKIEFRTHDITDAIEPKDVAFLLRHAYCALTPSPLLK